MSQLTDQFIDALHRLEGDRDLNAMASLFSEDAEVANPLIHRENGGARAAKEFWSQYRDAFDDIRSDFRSVRDTDGVAFLEWHSEGSIDGQSFHYDGVSVIEEADGKIIAFRTYFDTRHIPNAHTRSGNGDAAGSTRNGNAASAGSQGQGGEAGRDEVVEAQREAAEQRADGGYS
ncbi:ketosteroid isomerase-like protein [Pseudorhizobium tarimense]|uniref:Ketosteroid isomerase-like protein n=1 Tax=Pseudorhizobium tarimense TaxID=1079109 RepID=A0ABV2H3T3_9HYPH|nr:nuclear transport factor 2 family protein [Pseudorhizobium tarimense]MCJ8518380.1 nuclear transport factor 2 family protein [Pseudorhizobium tarimense]